MEIVISALHFEWDTVEGCLDRAERELGLDGIELSWNAAFRRPSCTRQDLEELRRLKGRSNLKLDAHIWEDLAQLGPGAGDEALVGWLEWCEQTGVRGLIVHGGTYRDQEEGIARTRAILARVLPRFERAGVAINIENHYAYDYEGCQELFSEPWEFEAVFSLDSPSLRFCFDTGHAHLTRNADELLRGLSRRLAHVHLADNYGEHDDHCMFRQGTVPWDAMFDTLEEIGFDGSFCVEFPVRGDLGPFRACTTELRKRFG